MTQQARPEPPHGPFPPLPEGRYDIIYADPPWDYKGQLQHAGPGSGDTGGAVRHYPTVTLDDLKRLDVPGIAADDCLLFMWATNPHLDQAIDLGKAWGFAWATVAFVWDKQRVNPGFYHPQPVRTVPRLQARTHPPPQGLPERAAAGERPPRAALRQARRSPAPHRRNVPGAAQDRTLRPVAVGRLGRVALSR